VVLFRYLELVSLRGEKNSKPRPQNRIFVSLISYPSYQFFSKFSTNTYILFIWKILPVKCLMHFHHVINELVLIIFLNSVFLSVSSDGPVEWNIRGHHQSFLPQKISKQPELHVANHSQQGKPRQARNWRHSRHFRMWFSKMSVWLSGGPKWLPHWWSSKWKSVW